MTPYNGHPSWNAWNVALWISNDEPIYRAAVKANGKVRKFRELTGLRETDRTPDGARYSNRSVSLALNGLLDE